MSDGVVDTPSEAQTMPSKGAAAAWIARLTPSGPMTVTVCGCLGGWMSAADDRRA